MKFRAEIDIMPRKELLDPQGKAVLQNLGNIGFDQAHDVRVGKRVELVFEADDESAAQTSVNMACAKLLSNVIMETYSFELTKIED